MSNLTQKDLRFPVNSENAKKIRGVITRARHEQSALAAAAAAAFSGGMPATHSGKIESLFLVLAAPCATGESATIDVLKNGVTILSAPYAVTSATPADQQIEIPVVVTDIAIGDKLTVTRTYVAGGTPAAPANSVNIEWA